MPMTLRQIIQKTDRTRRLAANYVDIKATKVDRAPSGAQRVRCKTLSKSVIVKNDLVKTKPSGSAHTYVTTVEVYLPKKYAVVSCSCDDFKFTWEYALNKQKAARIEYCNGEHPQERNPSLVPGCCKHIVAVAQMLIDKGKV